MGAARQTPISASQPGFQEAVSCFAALRRLFHLERLFAAPADSRGSLLAGCFSFHKQVGQELPRLAAAAPWAWLGLSLASPHLCAPPCFDPTSSFPLLSVSPLIHFLLDYWRGRSSPQQWNNPHLPNQDSLPCQPSSSPPPPFLLCPVSLPSHPSSPPHCPLHKRRRTQEG